MIYVIFSSVGYLLLILTCYIIIIYLLVPVKKKFLDTGFLILQSVFPFLLLYSGTQVCCFHALKEFI